MPIETTKRFNLISAFLAFLLWGGWAFYVNGGFDGATRIISGMTQGVASFIITLIMVRVVGWIFNRLPDDGLRLLLPAIITVFCTGSVLYFVHTLVGTPKIIHTIVPALSVAFLFCVYTAFRLQNAIKIKDSLK